MIQISCKEGVPSSPISQMGKVRFGEAGSLACRLTSHCPEHLGRQEGMWKRKKSLKFTLHWKSWSPLKIWDIFAFLRAPPNKNTNLSRKVPAFICFKLPGAATKRTNSFPPYPQPLNIGNHLMSSGCPNRNMAEKIFFSLIFFQK